MLEFSFQKRLDTSNKSSETPLLLISGHGKRNGLGVCVPLNFVEGGSPYGLRRLHFFCRFEGNMSLSPFSSIPFPVMVISGRICVKCFNSVSSELGIQL